MQLAVSNIAWGADDFKGFVQLLSELECDGVELAPSLLWDDPLQALADDRQTARRMIEDVGLRLAGFHSLFYQLPDLQLFTTTQARSRLADFAKGLISLCADMNGTTLVWGSPKNRHRGKLGKDEAVDIAEPFFCDLAVAALDHGVTICIEPLGREETDFIASCDEGMALVRRVDHPGFKLHLDAKAIITNGEDIGRIVTDYHPSVRHVHIGDPGLTPPGSSGYDHGVIGQALRSVGYAHFVSIEMRKDFGPPQKVITDSVNYVRQQYFAGE